MSVNLESTRLDHQPLFGKGACAPTRKALLGEGRRPDTRNGGNRAYEGTYLPSLIMGSKTLSAHTRTFSMAAIAPP